MDIVRRRVRRGGRKVRGQGHQEEEVEGEGGEEEVEGIVVGKSI